MANMKFMFIRGPFKLNISRNSATITMTCFHFTIKVY